MAAGGVTAADDRAEPRARLGPGSLSARHYGDVRVLAVASRALVLQVAHPVVGAGVAEHSDFRADPWGRLVRTLDTVTPLIYGTEARARAVGEALREGHRGISGTDDRGRRYTAFDPEAWYWVHATLLDAVLTASRHFGPRLDPADRPRLYDEFCVAGDALGVDPRQVPDTIEDYEDHLRTTIAERLEDNAAVRDVLATLHLPRPPAALPDPLHRVWPLAWLPARRVLRVSSVAVLPSVLRARLGLSLSRRDRLEFATLAATVRTAFAALPADARLLPQARRERRRTLGAGPAAS